MAGKAKLKRKKLFNSCRRFKDEGFVKFLSLKFNFVRIKNFDIIQREPA